LFYNDIKTPFIAAAEDFLNIPIVWKLMRGAGAFFLRRKPRPDDELYKVVLKEYI